MDTIGAGHLGAGAETVVTVGAELPGAVVLVDDAALATLATLVSGGGRIKLVAAVVGGCG